MKQKALKKRTGKVGLPPGTPIYVGEKKIEKVKISVINYDETQFLEKETRSPQDILPLKEKPTVTWISIAGIHEVDTIEEIGRSFGLHPLIVEDIVNTDQRIKMEDFGNYIFVVLKMFFYDENKNEINAEQMSLILGSNFVISFLENESDIFKPIKERIQNGKGRARKLGADYLAYSLLDAIVDNYFVILEKLGERIEDLEDELVVKPEPKILEEIHRLRREMIFLRKSVWPLREIIACLERGETSLIQKSTEIYIRDVYDHTIQVMDAVETYRDMLAGMLETYLSSISNKMNEIMKVLTIIATIFIPLTFIAGVYGMNFKFMPELGWRWSYLIIWAIMIVVAVFMIFFFKRKKWI
jgi:magnesium transporter